MMQWINNTIGVLLGKVMHFFFQLTGSYGTSIILFALAAKLIMLPISLFVQKNAIKLVKLNPELDEIKQRYGEDKDKVAEEQMALYKREKYNPMLGTVPLLLQIPLIFGLINVIYNPLQHLLSFTPELIATLTERTSQALSLVDLGAAPQLRIVEAIHNPALTSFFEGMPLDAISTIRNLNLDFFGINLSLTPSLDVPSILLLIPILSALSALLMCVIQNRFDVLQRTQPAPMKVGMTVFMLAFSGYFALVVPTGVGLYWIVGNLASILVLILCNLIVPPKKHIPGYAQMQEQTLLTKEEKLQKSQDKQKEKEDKKRFYSYPHPKQLVVYSQQNGFYKYYKEVLEYVMENSDVIIHYISSDPRDRIFDLQSEQFQTYYISEKTVIPLMMKLEADIVLMTSPDLQKYYIKRSLVKPDIEYIFIDHGLTSLHLGYSENALDAFDTIFCNGQNQVDEIRAMEKVYRLPPKRVVKIGYILLDNMIKNYEGSDKAENEVKKILIAPSWQKDNILESCIEPLLDAIIGRGYHVIVRPHPEFVRRFPRRMDEIVTKYKDKLDENFEINIDFTNNVDVFTSDLIITDWSSIAHEFSYTTKKPSLFINTPMKVMNPEYKRIPLVPLDIALRDEIGHSVNIDAVPNVLPVIEEMIQNKDIYHDKIDAVMKKNVFNIGKAAEAGGKYLIYDLDKK